MRGRHPVELCSLAEPDREVVPDGIVVVAECRGLGIGRRLVSELLAEMERTGIRVAQAITEFDGVEFLVRCGFRPEPSRPVRLTLHRSD
ncbi:GNAT family N-acetyltransferase [Plantactinospora sp. KLBMP9567]|nr:GNAT family N-acetyltransferase [Plantactinospora sp. KLBMP9567]MDW5327615.1 GNAT family N-acetyltransferase [Plantactinospora sp. KLBMP9567]